MTTTPAAQANLMNTILGIGRLNQLSEENRSRQLLRKEVAEKKQQEVIAAEAKNREMAFGTQIESMFGEKPSPEISQFASEVRPMFQRGAEVEAPFSMGATSPSGFPLVSGIQRQVTPADIQGGFRQADVGARAATGARLRSLGVREEEPVYQEMMTQRQTPLPSQAAARLKEAEGVEQGRIKTKADIVGLKRAESGLRVEEATEKPKIAREEAVSRREMAAANVAEIEEVFAVEKQKHESQMRVHEEAIKRAKVAGLPTEAAQAEANLAKTRLEYSKLGEELRHTVKVRSQIDRVNSLPDGPDKAKAIQDLAVLQGHNVEALIRHPLEIKKAYGHAVERSTAGAVELRKLVASGDIPGAQILSKGVNRMAVTAAEIADSPTTTITSVVPGGGGIFGGGGAQVGKAEVPTYLGKYYAEDMLNKAAMMQVTLPGISPAQALEAQVRMDHSYAGTDTTVFARAVAQSSAPMAVKDGALKLLQKASNVVKPVAAEPGPPTRVGAPGLSPEGTVTEAGALIGRGLEKGLGKIAPYHPMTAPRSKQQSEKLPGERY